MEEEVWVFDFDGTLVESSKNNIELLINDQPVELGIAYFWSKTYKLFTSLRNSGIPVVILTARHPYFKTLIQQRMAIEEVYCRDYCLDLDEIRIAYEQEDLKRDFLHNMIKFKATKLNALSFQYKRVMFLEDYACEFNKRETIPSPYGVGGTTDVPILNENVYPILPFHITNGGNTIDGAIEYFKNTGQIR